MLTETIRSHTFLRVPLEAPGAVVLDIGANFGDFSMNIYRQFACRCIAVEPNPVCHHIIKTMFGIEVLPYAVTDRTSDAQPFSIDQWNPEASRLSATPTGLSVPATTLNDLLNGLNLDRVALVKMDIEGAEYGVLIHSDPSVLSRIDQIAVEFHPARANVAWATEFVLAKLKRCGFAAFQFSRSGYGDMLLVNTRNVPLSLVQACYLRAVARPARGIARIAQRQGRHLRETVKRTFG